MRTVESMPIGRWSQNPEILDNLEILARACPKIKIKSMNGHPTGSLDQTDSLQVHNLFNTFGCGAWKDCVFPSWIQTLTVLWRSWVNRFFQHKPKRWHLYIHQFMLMYINNTQLFISVQCKQYELIAPEAELSFFFFLTCICSYLVVCHLYFHPWSDNEETLECPIKRRFWVSLSLVMAHSCNKDTSYIHTWIIFEIQTQIWWRDTVELILYFFFFSLFIFCSCFFIM